MGRLVISHHKSYHPYRRDNIERVKRDEEEARIKEEQEEGRMAVADAEARIKLLRERAGVKPKAKRLTVEQELEAARESLKDQESSGLPLSKGHINFFEDLEQQSSIAAAVQTSRITKANEVKEDEKGVRLAPSEKDLKPWYSSSKQEPQLDKNRKSRDDFRKSTHDPLTFINDRLHSRPSSSIASSSRHQSTSRQSTSSRPPRPQSTTVDDGDPYAPALPQAPKPAVDPVSARLSRESAERARAQALLAKKARESATVTPSTVHGGYGDMYNRTEVEAARAARRWGEHDRDEGRSWDRRTRDQRW